MNSLDPLPSTWQHMMNYDRLRLFGTETPIVFDYVAYAVVMVGVDALSSWPGWVELVATLSIWIVANLATSYYRAKEELGQLEMERMRAELPVTYRPPHA